MTHRLAPDAAKALVHSGQEVAFLDLREAGQFGEGHPLFATPCPYSRLEAWIATLVPRPGVPVLLLDAGDGVGERSARRLAAMGYRDVAIVAGGAPGWAAAGYMLFKGVNVPSKTLGELAENEWRPATITPEDAARMIADGRLKLYDGRPPAEYARMHVPGAVCLPNGELAHRLPVLATDSPVAVGCAGRTRGLVGAIGLQVAGHAGPVYALENGTQGWALAGLDLVRGDVAAPLPALDAAGRAITRDRAEAMARNWEIPFVDAVEVAGFLGDAARTTFVLDVRSEAEVATDPLAVARSAPGGQLVQATDHYVGVRHARLVLCDDCGLRAALAAFWLSQLGFSPVIARIDDALRALVGPVPAIAPPGPPVSAVGAGAALEGIAAGGRLLDARPSGAFRAGHVEGAIWITRAGLPALVEGDATPLYLVCDDDLLPGILADLAEQTGAPVYLVAGGQPALAAASARIAVTPDEPDDLAAIDFLRFVHDRHDGNLEASRCYLAWETGLVAQLDAAERAAFRLHPAPDRSG